MTATLGFKPCVFCMAELRFCGWIPSPGVLYMICVMLRCNIIPEFRARCPDMDPFPQRVPTSSRREASLLNLPETLSFRHFFGLLRLWGHNGVTGIWAE